MALRTAKRQFCVFTHVASIYANLLEQKKAFTQEKSSTPTGLVWDTKMAVVSLFWDTNMAAMTSCELSYRFDGQNNNSARASRFFVYFFAVVARLERETS